MDFNTTNAKALLGQFSFAKLFVDELGWDQHGADLSVPISGTTYLLKAAAQKRGMVAWVCQAPAGQRIPDRGTRKKIEHQVGWHHIGPFIGSSSFTASLMMGAST